VIDLPLVGSGSEWQASLVEDEVPAEVLRLHRLAAGFSSALLSLDPAAAAEIEHGVAGVLQELGAALDADRTAFLELRGDSIEHACTWCRPGQDLPDRDGSGTRVSWAIDVLTKGRPVVCEGPADLPGRVGGHPPTGVKSALVVPVALAGHHIYAVAAASIRLPRTWSTAVVHQMRLIAEILASTLHRCRLEQTLAGRPQSTRRRAPSATCDPGEEVDELRGLDEIVGDSPALKDSLDRLRQVADTHSTVLLLGETGTGKELFASAVHARSPRQQQPFVRVNCAALPVTVIDSELFGHERGAFTGAASSRQGRFELADRGTLFLDEIGDLPPEVQVKLLRVLQEREFERIGSSQTRRVNVRLIAATHHDLEALVAAGRFRADLFYRISTFPIVLPPLRERREDISHLVLQFIQRRQHALHREITHVPEDVMRRLTEHRWPGNVRELQNVIERAMIHSSGRTLVLDELSSVRTEPASDIPRDASLEVVERSHILAVLDRCGWRINGAGNAAERLGLHPNTLRFRMKKLGVTRPERCADSARHNTGSFDRRPVILS